MDGHRFDAVVRGFGAASSRRQVLGRLLSGAAGGALSVVGWERAIAQDDDDDDDDDNGNNINNRQDRQCRAEGQPCEGNQQCCDGLACAQSGQGTAMRCTANATECEDDCPPAEEDAAQTEGAICRNEGESCGGDQLCCEGLLCGPSGKDQATRCVSESEPVETCEEGTCEPTEVRLQKPRAYKVEADCQYNEDDDRTTCDCKASSDDSEAPTVRRVTLPQSDICAEVIEGDYEVRNTSRNTARETTNTASAGTGGEANASADGGAVVVGDVEGNTAVNVDASGGNAQADASGGDNNVAIAGGRGVRYESRVDRDTLQLTFAGRVEPTGNATYWCETEDGVVPAAGPALARIRDEAADAGAIVVRTAACDIDREQEGFDWFGECRRPAKARLRLRAQEGNDFVERETAATDNSGRRGFRNLVAGTYRVAPEGAGWCHAECDSVDEQGDIVLQAGQQTTVWLFNCTKGR